MGKQRDKLAKQQKSVLNRKHIKPISKAEKKSNQLKQNAKKKHQSNDYQSQVQELLERAHGKKNKKAVPNSNGIQLKPATLQLQEETSEDFDDFAVTPQVTKAQTARPVAQRLQRMQSNIFDSLEEVDDCAEEDMSKFMFPLKPSALSNATFRPASAVEDDL